ncbi:hypothetical protein [Streptomyces sp. MI02-7b]|uniref:hypothetical protein n=1 Tax=Streptomyces sp. MI02-7b TaxID=462941 RepID=UPI0029A94F9B|nr:hypothetical protein [Streptomyces sp. MI02-7b]MDX3078401.1 hypothetical protein [Streptomyces sp. MI02-7b]
MTSDHDLLWHRCVHLGHVLLPLVDQEPRRQTRRHETLQGWGISTAEGEQLIEIFAALAAHAAATEASLSAAEFGSLPLKAVADAAIGKSDIELLAGVPAAFADGTRDGQMVGVFRLYVYRGGPYSHRLFRLSRELHYALITLAERSPTPSTTCGDLFRRWDTEVGLPQAD